MSEIQKSNYKYFIYYLMLSLFITFMGTIIGMFIPLDFYIPCLVLSLVFFLIFLFFKHKKIILSKKLFLVI